MTLKNKLLTYLGFCPTKVSTQGFQAPVRIQVSQSAIMFSIIVFSVVVAGFIIVFVPDAEPPPSWFIVEPKFSSDNNIILNISEQDLSPYPQVLDMIISIEMRSQPNPVTGLASDYSPRPWKKMNHEEAITLMAMMGGEYKSRVKSYSFTFKMNDDLYSLQMYYSSSPPSTL